MKRFVNNNIFLGNNRLACCFFLFCAASPAIAQHPLDFAAGKALFDKNWVASPASTTASDGLGPLYNARSCRQCHQDNRRMESTVVFLPPESVYGRQVQPFAVPGLKPEATVIRESVDIEFTLPDGSPARLQKPVFSLAGLRHGELDQEGLSPRLAPALGGVALLEKIDPAQLQALADPDDSDGDGISGRLHRVPDPNGGQPAVGRFGWKAEQADLRRQVAAAMHADLGLGNPLHPAPWGDCTGVQADCRNRIHGGDAEDLGLEASGLVLDLVTQYVRGLSPVSAEVATGPGRQVFMAVGCAACHRETFMVDGMAIRPYSDLLLHDMGGPLAAGFDRPGVTAVEWRTAPLWNLGQATGAYLHDGRARTLEEAVLWHGGEASGSVARFLALPAAERKDLIRFLDQL